MREELKPCPFCGKQGALVRHYGFEANGNPMWSIECCSRREITKKGAVAAWNRRTPAPGDKARDNEVLEAVAEECHRQWSGWTEYLLGKMAKTEGGDYYTLSSVWVERWRRQIGLPYAELRDDEKNSDRVEARKILARIRSIMGEADGEVKRG